MSGAIADAFDEKLRALPAKLTHNDLVRLYPPLPTSSANRSTTNETPLEQVRFHVDFAASPDEINARSYEACEAAAAIHGADYVTKILASDKHHALKAYRSFDFRLTHEETQILEKHGFVVSPRLASSSFGTMYYRLYTNDLPVFVTSDSVLHAWHYSFDAFVMQLESELLLPLITKVLHSALAACTAANDTAVGPRRKHVRDACTDVELYLSVAYRLLNEGSGRGRSVAQLRGNPNANRLETLVEHVKQEQLTKTDIFGSRRDIDFSLFKPRGHYTKTENLQRFFRAMVWLGTIDFRVDGTARNNDEDAKANERRQLQCACLLVHILEKAGVMPFVKTLHETIGAIAGDGVGADSMTPIQLSELLAGRDVLATFFGLDSDDQLRALQDEIANAGLGAQAISGHPMEAGGSSKAPTRPPTAFAFVGQQFVWSAFVFSKLVFDKVIDEATGQKVPRRMVSAVDAAFALFGNNVAGVEIAKRMRLPKAGGEDLADRVAFRDGLPYAPSLLAARAVVDEAMDKAIDDPASCSLALLWQLALRELSRPASHSDQVFASEAWQKRQMNTQIASFAQLRHDTILYAKQACTAFAECEYPAGFVDPYPSFWMAIRRLAKRTLAAMSKLKRAYAGNQVFAGSRVLDSAEDCFKCFVDVTDTLAGIAEAQAAQRELSSHQVRFLKNIIEMDEGSGDPSYSGWYPSLFFSGGEDSCEPDHLVADIHTDAPSNVHGDPGGVLHLGVGDVNLGAFVVDGVMYAGPVFSHYEFVTPIDERLTDDEFSAQLGEFEPPKWATESFLAPLPDGHHRSGKERIVCGARWESIFGGGGSDY